MPDAVPRLGSVWKWVVHKALNVNDFTNGFLERLWKGVEQLRICPVIVNPVLGFNVHKMLMAKPVKRSSQGLVLMFLRFYGSSQFCIYGRNVQLSAFQQTLIC